MAASNWTIKSIDIMSRTKDTMRGQLSTGNMATICNNIARLGVTHIALACPLDEPADYPPATPTAGYGGSLDDFLRSEDILKVYKVFSDKSYIKGVNYWQAVSGTDAKENILDHSTYALKQSSQVIKKYYQNTARIAVL